MNYGTVKYNDIANGTGVRTSLFVSGCTHHCKGCFNEETWDFNYGEPFTEEIQKNIINSLEPYYISGLSVLGGEPFEQPNQIALLPFIKKVKETYPDKTIWFYSGYTLEELSGENKRCRTDITDELLSYIDVLVDGEYIEEKKNISLRFRGSENQRLINLKESLKENKIIFWTGE